jgi:hypothetical protein
VSAENWIVTKNLAVNRFPQDNARTWAESPAMRQANFCAECGERLIQNGWRAVLQRRLCDHCARRLGNFAAYRPLMVIGLIAAVAFGLGRYLRPSPPPLLIQRAANSPLSDAPVQFSGPSVANAGARPSNNLRSSALDDEVYICGARTRKGTPCRRRVHAAGERCFQHKGMPAMVALDKLTIKP